VRAQRAVVLTAAYTAHPERFINKLPDPPKIPEHSWINPPDETETAAQ
jgi:putative transposase